MAVVQKKYQGDGGDIHRIRLSSDKFAVNGNPEPAGAINSDVRVKVSKGNREYGIRPRGVILSRVVIAGTAPNTVEKTLTTFLPLFTEANYDSAAYNLNAVVAYKGSNWNVNSKRPEDY